MEDIENVLDNEPVAEAEEDTEEVIEETDVADEDADDDFEYDDDGNIIIPDVNFDDEDEPSEDEADDEVTEEESTEEESEDEEDGESDEVPAEEQKAEDDTAEEDTSEPDPRDEEIKRLRAEIKKYQSQGKDTLEALGYENPDDVILGLEKLAAESKDQSLEEYQQDKAKREQQRTAQALLQNELFEQKAKADLNELHLNFPETRQYKHVRELPEEIRKKFGAFRDKGLTAKEAYAAANPDGARDHVAAAVKKQAMHDSKAHLQSSVPKASKNTSVSIPKSELGQWRELFPGKSDEEINALYRQTMN